MSKTFSKQNTLPHLPVAHFQEACDRYLRVVKPLVSSEQYEKTVVAVRKFISDGTAPELHRKLVERSKVKDNWLEEWWDTAAYYQVRAPVIIETNPGLVSEDVPSLKSIPSSRVQTWRAAQMVHSAMHFLKEIQNNTLEPDHNSCMSQYARLFGVCRIPAENQDRLINYLGQPNGLPTKHFLSEFQPCNPKHIVVISKGHFFSVNALSDSSEVISVDGIESQLLKIVQITQNLQHAGNGSIGILTASDRDFWTKAREALILSSPLNKESLETIQKALFVVVLDEDSPQPQNIVRFLIAGDARSRFHDKHMMIIFKNGKSGLTFEHGATDGLTLVRLLNYINSHSSINSFTKDLNPSNSYNLLKWVLSNYLEKCIIQAIASFTQRESELDLITEEFTDFGKEEIKKTMGCSPDAFFQMAIQLGFYKLFGFCVPTYESGATRQFLHGRTETIRSVSSDSRNWVESMSSPRIYTESKRATQASLLRSALGTHSHYSQDAVKGNGCDRFLLGCYILSLESNKPLPDIFTDPTFSYCRNFQLSTSSMPTNEVVAFGPVVPNGFGVYYCFPSNSSSIKYTLTSFHGHNRPVNLFAQAINDSMREMAILLRKNYAKL